VAADSRLRLILSGIPALSLVTGCLMVEGNKKIPQIPAFLFLGDASYSIYLWHTLTIVVAAAMEQHFGMDKGIMAGILVGVLSLLAPLFAYVLIERPLLARIPPGRSR
jgi:exopolysaccharide production protein ExoZ